MLSDEVGGYHGQEEHGLAWGGRPGVVRGEFTGGAGYVGLSEAGGNLKAGGEVRGVCAIRKPTSPSRRNRGDTLILVSSETCERLRQRDDATGGREGCTLHCGGSDGVSCVVVGSRWPSRPVDHWTD
jgi:hypothetical protein